MPPEMGSINRECENSTCSRRDTENESLSMAAPTNTITSPPTIGQTFTRRKFRDNRNVQVIIDFLHHLKEGRHTKESPNGCVDFKLRAAQFRRMEAFLYGPQQIDSLGDWYDNNIVYDFDPCPQRYTVRMPSALHECFIAGVVDAFDNAISDTIAQQKIRRGEFSASVVDALKGVYKGGSATVELDRDNSRSPIRRSPDASYYHNDTGRVPQMVIEVGYSQQQAELKLVADSYIVDSHHDIACVLGIDIPYRHRNGRSRSKACHNQLPTISVWRPCIVHDVDGEETGAALCHVDSVAFRNHDKSPCEGFLTLMMSDILPQITLRDLPPCVKNEKIRIPFADLTRALNAAEARQATMTAKTDRISPPSTPTKFRKRKRTPTPELSDERERYFIEQEMAEMKKDWKADRSWRSPSNCCSKMVDHDVKRRRSPRNSAVHIKCEDDAG